MVKPLFDYLIEHGISSSWLRQVVNEHQGLNISVLRWYQIRSGQALLPVGFMEGCCRELGIEISWSGGVAVVLRADVGKAGDGDGDPA